MINNYNENAVPTIISYLSGKGLNNNGISGLLGNIYSESRLYPNNLQNSYESKLGYTDETYTKAVDNGSYSNFVRDSAGYGLCQWTFWSRKQGLLDYVKSKKKSIGDLQSQIEYMYQELSTGHKDVLKELCSATNSVDSCARIVMTKYEKPANQSEQNQLVRVGYAQDFFNAYFKVADKPVDTPQTNFEYKVCLLTNNACYKDNYAMQPQGIVVHSTGANNPYLKRYVQPDDGILGVNKYNNSWNRSGVNVCVHAFIGKDQNGTVRCYQTLPWEICCWGVGRGNKGSYNYPASKKYPQDRSFIQFEMCEDDLNNKQYFDDVMDTATSLCAMLCKKYNLPVSEVVSHHETYVRGFGSNHADCDHWLKRFGKDMDWFRSVVSQKMSKTVSNNPQTNKTPTNNGKITHTVVKNETLYGIARQLKLEGINVTWQEIAELNNIKAPYTIHTGDILRIK